MCWATLDLWVRTDGQLVLVVDLAGVPQLGHCPVGPAGSLVRLWPNPDGYGTGRLNS